MRSYWYPFDTAPKYWLTLNRLVLAGRFEWMRFSKSMLHIVLVSRNSVA